VAGGVVAAVVAWGGAFAVVLAGLTAVGASDAEAASGLLALSIGMGVLTIWVAARERIPVTIAWSTPGAALLVSAGAVEGGWPAAVGAFVVCGVLLALTGLWRPLGRLIAAIPAPLASAMLAGVLLTVCLTSVRFAVDSPLAAAPVALTWAVLLRFARRWATLGALVAAVAVVAVDPSGRESGVGLVPAPVLTAPVFEPGVLVGLALPLFIVTMASQNVTGMTVLGTYGYRPRLPGVLAGTGAATVAAAPFGGHALNLAAISAALTAGPAGGRDPARRWIAALAAGVTYIALGLGAGLLAAFAAAAPPLLIEAVAGLALLGALAGALGAATASEQHRDAAVVTLVVSASGVAPLGVSAPFWGLVAGLALLAVQHRRAA
jgi:benzoate membrane transport protein